MSEETTDLLRSSKELLERFEKTLERMNETPSSAPAPVAEPQKGAGDETTPVPGPVSKMLTADDRIQLQRELRKKSTPELHMLFSEQARQKETGVPLHMWLNAGGYSAQQRFDGIHANVDPDISKAIDTSSASALIRQDLEPLLYELYVREFPAFDRFAREPANGLVHAYNQITAYGDAQFMPELGTVTDDKSTYTRQTTNIAILATRRGVSLKSQFSVIAGGMGYNPEGLELQGGLRSMAHKMQYQIFSGHSTDSGGTTSNELGLYDANAFTGLRSILNTARAKNVDPLASTPESMRQAINQAAVEIVQSGGRASILWGNPFSKETFDNQQDGNVRYMAPENLVNVSVGVVTNAVNTIMGPLPFAIVPGDSISNYATADTGGSFVGGENVRDIYILDESTISLPYLGTSGPTVLDIPIGISGQLVHLFIIFGMWGLAVKAPQFSNKVRVKSA